MADLMVTKRSVGPPIGELTENGHCSFASTTGRVCSLKILCVKLTIFAKLRGSIPKIKMGRQTDFLKYSRLAFKIMIIENKRVAKCDHCRMVFANTTLERLTKHR